MAEEPSLAEVARRLYGRPLTEFIAARDAEARALKGGSDRALAGRVKQLRKPAAGVHLVNRLVRDDAALVAEVDDLGHRLRSAQAQSDARQLRALDQERRSLVNRAVEAAAALAARDGVQATEASLRDVEQTVWAAIVDLGAFTTVQAGMLVRPLSPGGFGAVDLSDASAVPVRIDEVAARRSRKVAGTKAGPRAGTKAAPKESAATRKAEAERRARAAARQDAHDALDAATERLERAEQAHAERSRPVDASRKRLTDLTSELDEVRERLASLEHSIRDEQSTLSHRETELRDAAETHRAAAAQAEQARRRLDELPE